MSNGYIYTTFLAGGPKFEPCWVLQLIWLVGEPPDIVVIDWLPVVQMAYRIGFGE